MTMIVAVLNAGEERATAEEERSDSEVTGVVNAFFYFHRASACQPVTRSSLTRSSPTMPLISALLRLEACISDFKLNTYAYSYTSL
ncbi:hypothetical protein [Halobacillus sp. B29]|uniref:hypothetical protein n=1 Tax=Halobacillus sp. B29 TaxID=3457432 RepID=UPI003FCE7E14